MQKKRSVRLDAKQKPAAAGLGPDDPLDLVRLRARYGEGSLTPTALVEGVLDRIRARGDDKVWIHLVPAEQLLAVAAALEKAGPAGKPLWGVPFAIKDNIDLGDHPTTAACPEFAYVAPASATAVARLVAAGAIPIGKTNLDQFATGLNGTRSPYGAPASATNPGYISGGSSSGSAVAVAAGLVSFALGTDTAGSGRVPAMLNNIVGLKPTRGLISTKGVVPACRSLDCVSIFALTAGDAAELLALTKGFDAGDSFSRQEGRGALPGTVKGLRFGVPAKGQAEFFGNDEGARLFKAAQKTIEKLGGTVVAIDVAPFLDTARLLYDGPWVAERYAALREFFTAHPQAFHPVTREIVASGAKPLAADGFEGYYRLKEMRRVTDVIWQKMDVLLLPTAPRTYTIAEMLADPIQLNSNLGVYTNFVNLLDLSAIAIPAGWQKDGLPFGTTLLAPAWNDIALCALGDAIHRAQNLEIGALGLPLPAPRADARAPVGTNGAIKIAVCGAHMEGLPLNHQLTDRGASLVKKAKTAKAYKLYALPGGPPARPGMVRAPKGAAIEVEVWELPEREFGGFMKAIPAPLSIGTIELAGGDSVKGFLCEAAGLKGAKDITALGGWRRYLKAQKMTRTKGTGRR